MQNAPVFDSLAKVEQGEKQEENLTVFCETFTIVVSSGKKNSVCVIRHNGESLSDIYIFY